MMMLGEARLRVTLAGQTSDVLKLDICRMGSGIVGNTPVSHEWARMAAKLCGFQFVPDPDAGSLVVVICQLPAGRSDEDR